jgi:serine/threonine protein kinase
MSFMEDRIDKYFILRRLLESITTAVYDVCVNGTTKFGKKLNKISHIGSGSFGKVYLASLNKHEFVVKEASTSVLQTNNIIKNKKSFEILPKESYVEEYRIMELLSLHVIHGGFPNFILNYNAAVCETCGYYMNETCFISFMEPAMCDLDKFIYNTDGMYMISNYDTSCSIIYQLFLGIYILHLKYGIVHTDLKSDNILVLRVEPGGYFRYILNGKEYFVRNYGYLFCIHDFGLAKMRNDKKRARVLSDGRIEMMSFKMSNSEIDLSDMMQFPYVEFFNDLQDLIKIFVDGICSDFLNTHLNQKLKSIKRQSFACDENSAIFLRADMMLDYLYEKPIGVTKHKVIQTFYE